MPCAHSDLAFVIKGARRPGCAIGDPITTVVRHDRQGHSAFPSERGFTTLVPSAHRHMNCGHLARANNRLYCAANVKAVTVDGWSVWK